MSKQREALQMALDALEKYGTPRLNNEDAYSAAIKTIREALAEPEKTNQCGETCERAKLCAVCAGGVSKNEQEPVAWMCADEDMTRKGYSRFSRNCEGEWNIPVYTAPPARKPLTDEDISAIVQSMSAYTWDAHMLARAIEKAHGITG